MVRHPYGESLYVANKDQSILEVFGDKSQLADNIKNIRGSLLNVLGSSLYKLGESGQLSDDDMKNILKNTGVDFGFDLGDKYGLNLGINQPNPSGHFRDDYRVTLSRNL